MRAVCIVLAAVGGCAMAAAIAIELARGNPAGVGWVVVGPAGPFYAAGLIGVVRRPGNRVAAWLLACGATFMLSVCLGDILGDGLPAMTGFSAWLVVVAAEIASNASVVAGIGLIGLFPTGIPQRRGERWVLRSTAAMAVALPLLVEMTSPAPPTDLFGYAGEPAIASPLYLPAARPAEPAVVGLHHAFTALTVLGVIMLYLRYRRSAAEDRRRIRFLLVGAVAAMVVFGALVAVALAAPQPSLFEDVAIFVLWVLGVVLVLGSLVLPLSQGVLGIDQSARRSVVYRALWLVITVAYLAAAATLGLLASHVLSAGPAVLLAVAATLAFQPVQRRLERLADRWVFGDRLDSYEVLSRFGSMLEAAPGPADTLPRLADAIRRGLGLQWARVRLDPGAPGGSAPLAGAAGIGPADVAEPALVVPLTSAGTVLGQIECGPRRDGPLLDEDRRLLASLAGQAATAVRNLHLAAELSARLATIRQQAAELTASRARVALAQDAERQRIQRDLHDGVQQDVVVLTAKLALARERLRRGDQRADELARRTAAGSGRPARSPARLRAHDPSARARRPGTAGGDRGPGRAAAGRGHDRGRHRIARRPLSAARRSRHLVRRRGGADQRGQARPGQPGARRADPAEREPGGGSPGRRLRVRPGRRPGPGPGQPGRPDIHRERSLAHRQRTRPRHHAARRGPAGDG